MNTLSKSIKHILKTSLLVTAFGTVSMAYADNNDMYKTNDKLHDAWLDGKVETAMLVNRHLNNFKIDTEVKGNQVFLTGTVKSSTDKELAEKVAQNIKGVTAVTNNLKIDNDVKYTPQNVSNDDERTWSTWFDDAGITAAVKGNLMLADEVDSLEINVDTMNSVVTLTGDADNKSNLMTALSVAKNTSGVRQVINNMTVDGKADNYIDNNADYANDWNLKDAWIDGKIESALLVNTHLNNFTIDTEVNKGKAFLSGSVQSASDKSLATEIALSIEGVSSVENNLKVDRKTTMEKRPISDEDERTWSTWYNDSTTTASVKSKFLWNDRVDGLDINVDTVNGVVTLNGEADNKSNRKLAEQIASQTDGVRKVVNNLTIDMDG